MKESFKELVNSRKSVNNFIKDVEVTNSDLEEMFKLTSLAPSCFNLEHANYIVITDKDKKQKFYDEVCKQYKVLASSAVVMVFGDTTIYKTSPKLTSESVRNNIKKFYEDNISAFIRDEAIRNASLSAMMFMLSAKSLGFDTCPMMGFDIEKAKRFFNLEPNLEPVLLITLGKEDPEKPKVRESRKNLDELYKIW